MSSRFSSEYLSQLEYLKLESRKKFLGARHGAHVSLKKGHGIEFSDYRQYQLGDNPRYIDWKVYGRSDKLYVKRSQEEQDFMVSIFLDASSSMGLQSEPAKWEYTKDLALSLAYLSLMQQDKLNIEILGSKLRFSGNSLKSFWNISKQFSDYEKSRVEEEVQQSLAENLRAAATRTKFPGLGILITDLHFSIEELQQGIRYLQAKNLEIVVLQVIGQKDLQPLELFQEAELQDSESAENININFNQDNASLLTKLIEEHSTKCRNYLNKQQIAFAVFNYDQDLLTTLKNSKQALKVIR